MSKHRERPIGRSSSAAVVSPQPVLLKVHYRPLMAPFLGRASTPLLTGDEGMGDGAIASGSSISVVESLEG